jgi:hypothetical protein
VALVKAICKTFKARTKFFHLCIFNDLPNEFLRFFNGTYALKKVTKCKWVEVISNLYFFNLSKGVVVEFFKTFHPDTLPDFGEIFLKLNMLPLLLQMST